ncbi:MAG: hypothetical protein O2871_03675, partial [bacterium]|nr:hypothetical protein [bacterium]
LIPADIFFQTESEKFWDQSKSKVFAVIADNKWHKYVVNVGANNNWASNRIFQTRVDVGNTGNNKNVDFDLVWISKHAELAYDLNYDGI